MKRKYVYGECKCTVSDGSRLVQKHLHQSKKYLAELKQSNTVVTLKKQLNELDTAIKELTKLHQKEHTEAMEEYAMQMLDLVKTRDINAKPKQRKRVRLLPDAIGYEKILLEEQRLKEEKEKKNKKIKK